jgi:hypothetical protein
LFFVAVLPLRPPVSVFCGLPTGRLSPNFHPVGLAGGCLKSIISWLKKTAEKERKKQKYHPPLFLFYAEKHPTILWVIPSRNEVL